MPAGENLFLPTFSKRAPAPPRLSSNGGLELGLRPGLEGDFNLVEELDKCVVVLDGLGQIADHRDESGGKIL